MLPSVSSAGLHQVGYEIFATAATDATERRPSGYLLMTLTFKMRCPSLDCLPLCVTGSAPPLPLLDLPLPPYIGYDKSAGQTRVIGRRGSLPWTRFGDGWIL